MLRSIILLSCIGLTAILYIGCKCVVANETGNEDSTAEDATAVLSQSQPQNQTEYTACSECRDNDDDDDDDDSAPQDLPSAPENLKIVAYNKTGFITWVGIDGASSYNLYWNTAGSVADTDNKIADVTSPYEHTDLSGDTTYYYRIAAVNSDGEGALSAEEYGTLPPVFYVDATQADDTGDGSSATPKKVLQSGINLAAGNGDIRVKAGTYAEVTYSSGVSLFGGYAAADWNIRDPGVHVTTITDSRGAGNAANPPIGAIEISGAGAVSYVEGFTINGATIGNQYGSGVMLDDAGYIYIKNNIINGSTTGSVGNSWGIYLRDSNAEVTANTIHGGSNALQSRGIFVTGNTSAVIQDNQINGGDDIRIYGTGIRAISTGEVIIRRNLIDAGTPEASSPTWFTGLLTNVASLSVYNNTIYGGSQPASFALASFGYRIFSTSAGYANIRNNTIISGEVSMLGYGITLENDFSNYSIDISNNIIATIAGSFTRMCVSEQAVNSTPDVFANNNLYNCPSSLYGDQGGSCGGGCNDIDDVNSLADMDAGGNISEVVTYVNFDPPRNWHLSGFPHKNVLEGGLDGAMPGWEFSDDMDKAERTNSTSLEPTNAGAGGWTMGAFEE